QAQVAADDRLGERAEAAPAGELRQVAVIEGRERDAASLRHAPRAPRRVERITDLDETRLERVQQPCPAARVERQAVIEGARHGVARQCAHPATLELRRAARYHQGVLPGGMRGEPGVFGGEVAFDAAARRRIEQGRIDKMHGLFFFRPSEPWLATTPEGGIAPL